MDKNHLKNLYYKAKNQYDEYKNQGLKLDLSRGKPSSEQLDLSLGLFAKQRSKSDCMAQDGTDCRNYGNCYGLPEMRALWADLTGIPASQIIVGGNSSLNMMYDTMARAMIYGVVDSERPWCKEEKIKFLCPCPGYDRHFAICESMKIEMIPVPMQADGPDMDLVEKLVAHDASIKGIWCVPKYSNPTGVTYSDEVVTRLASMDTAAKDFRIFWDNAYIIHDLYDETVPLLDIFKAAEEYGNEDRIFYFSSTSKITFPGAGVAMMAASERNLAQIKPIMNIQTIGPDKLNQLRHIELLKNKEGVFEHMKLHRNVLSRKFRIVLDALEELRPYEIATWTNPRGGYFVSFDAMDGCATKIYNLCKEAGVTLTNVGATFPYGKDPKDKNLRLAPSYPTDADLALAMKVFVTVVKLVSFEKMISEG